MVGRKYQGVTAYVGMPGSGKSYSLVRVAKRAIERGQRVVCNAGFDVAGCEILTTFDEFAALEGPVVICWDELPLYFNARKWSEFPDSMLYKFTQIRKDGIELHYSAIHEQMIDVNIRRITFWFWQCRALGFGLHYRTLWPPELFRRHNEKPRRREFFRIDPSVAAMYDTTSKVALPEKVQARIRAGVEEHASWDRLGDGGVPSGVPGPRPSDTGLHAVRSGSWAAGGRS